MLRKVTGPWHMLLEVTFRSSKRSKDLIQPYQSTASLIMHILDHIKEDHKANFGSTRIIASSLVPRLSVGGEREGLVSTVCACA